MHVAALLHQPLHVNQQPEGSVIHRMDNALHMLLAGNSTMNTRIHTTYSVVATEDASTPQQISLPNNEEANASTSCSSPNQDHGTTQESRRRKTWEDERATIGCEDTSRPIGK
jgi:hypothetical protein